MSRPKRPGGQRLTLAIRVDAEAAETFEIRAMQEGLSVSKYVGRLLEEIAGDEPVDDLTRARYRKAKRENGRATPRDLFAASPATDLAASNEEHTRRGSNPQPLDSKSSALSNWTPSRPVLRAA